MPASDPSSAACHEHLRLLDSTGELLRLPPQSPKIALHLEPVPEILRLPEKRAKADRHLRGDRAFAVNNLVDRSWRDANGTGHGVLRDPSEHRPGSFG